MLTRKEELFVKPFQQRLYHQHIVKVSISRGTTTTTTSVYFRGGDISTKKNVYHPEEVYLFINYLLIWHTAYHTTYPSPENVDTPTPPPG